MPQPAGVFFAPSRDADGEQTEEQHDYKGYYSNAAQKAAKASAGRQWKKGE